MDALVGLRGAPPPFETGDGDTALSIRSARRKMLSREGGYCWQKTQFVSNARKPGDAFQNGIKGDTFDGSIKYAVSGPFDTQCLVRSTRKRQEQVWSHEYAHIRAF